MNLMANPIPWHQSLGTLTVKNLKVPYVCVLSLSRVRLFATPWTEIHQAPLSMRFSSKNTGVGCHFLLQGIFPIQGFNRGLFHCRQVLYHLSYQGRLYCPSITINPIPYINDIFSDCIKTNAGVILKYPNRCTGPNVVYNGK